jgi:hypothetical protein
LFLNVFDLLLRGFALLAIQFRCHRACQSPLRSVYYRRYHLQIVQ